MEPIPAPTVTPGILAALAGAADSTSAAVVRDGRIHHRWRPGRAEHSHRLLPLLDEILGELGLGPEALAAVAFTQGPGPFTAGRIVTATAQGLGLARGLPLIPVSSLAAAAWASGRDRCAVALAAGRGEVYWGCYERAPEGVRALTQEQAVSPEAAVLPADAEAGGGLWGVGGGWHAHGEALARRLGPALAGQDPAVEVTAEAVAALAGPLWGAGEVVDPAEAVPTYLRASYAERPH